MHQALTIQEILRIVFSFLQPECNVCNARVCRQWYNPALDAVWETGGLEMFQSLSSSQLTRSDAHDVPQIYFFRRPTDKDWRRFMANTARVRSWVEYFDPECDLSGQTRYEILETRPTVCLFPNLKRISTNNNRLFSYLLSQSVEELQLTLTQAAGESDLDPEDDIPLVFETIEDRLPRLQKLTIMYNDEEVPTFDEAIASLIGNLPYLRVLSLPRLCLDARLIHAISQHKYLTTIKYDITWPLVSYPFPEESRTLYDSTNWLLLHNALPSLQEFDTSVDTILAFSSFASQPGFPLRDLTTLRVHTDQIPLPSEVHRTLKALIPACPALRVLHLQFFEIRYEAPDAITDLTEITAIQIRHLLPINQLPNLESFTIEHPLPISTEDGDVHDIVSPTMTELMLNPYPIVPKETKVTLGALAALIAFSSRLRVVGLYVDAVKAPPTPLPPSSDRLSITLHLGHSPLSLDEDAQLRVYPHIACFLASVLSGSCTWVWREEAGGFKPQLIERQTWLHELTSFHQLEEYVKRWKTIHTMVKLVEWGRERGSR